MLSVSAWWTCSADLSTSRRSHCHAFCAQWDRLRCGAAPPYRGLGGAATQSAEGTKPMTAMRQHSTRGKAIKAPHAFPLTPPAWGTSTRSHCALGPEIAAMLRTGHMHGQPGNGRMVSARPPRPPGSRGRASADRYPTQQGCWVG